MAEKEPILQSPEQPVSQQPEILEHAQKQEKPLPKKADQPAQPRPVMNQPQVGASSVPKPDLVKSETLERIEDIMEEDLQDVYASLDPQSKQAFREKGEETAAELETLMFKVKVKSKLVFKLIFGWLKVIPGVNKYFLKQEAKLKADEILHLKEELDKQRRNQI